MSPTIIRLNRPNSCCHVIDGVVKSRDNLKNAFLYTLTELCVFFSRFVKKLVYEYFKGFRQRTRLMYSIQLLKVFSVLSLSQFFFFIIYVIHNTKSEKDYMKTLSVLFTQLDLSLFLFFCLVDLFFFISLFSLSLSAFFYFYRLFFFF